MAKSISRYLADISSTSGVLDGTLSTAAQTNITSLGTLSSLTVSGSAALTLTTAAQPNITSVGTLSTLAMGGSITRTGDLTLDVSGNIILDAGSGNSISVAKDGTAFGIFEDSSTDFVIRSAIQDKDILFKGNDGGSTITALTIDMSDAGAATFNNTVTIPKLLTLNNPDSIQAKFSPNNNSFAAVAEFYNGTSTSNPFVVGQGYATGTDNISYVWNRANADLLFGTNNTEKMRIDSAGRVLISNSNAVTGGFGTDTWQPKTQILETQGAAIVRIANSDTWGGALHLASANGTYASPTAAASGDKAGGVYFHANDGTDFKNYVAGIEAIVADTVASNDTPGYLKFSTTADGTNSLTERMRIDSSGDTTFSIDSNVILQGTHNEGGGLLFIKGTDTAAADKNLGSLCFGNPSDANLAMIRGVSTDTTAADLRFYTEAQGAAIEERMRITSGGKVGVGTTFTGGNASSVMTAPLNIKLTSGSSAAVATFNLEHLNSTASIEQRLQFNAGDDATADSYSNMGYIAFGKENDYVTDANRDSYLSFATAANASQAERMRITSAGHVGIADTPPAWGAAYVGLTLGSAGAIWGTRTAANLTVISDNSYHNGSNSIAMNTGLGSIYTQTAGRHVFGGFASVSAGAVQTEVTNVAFDANGGVGIQREAGRLIVGGASNASNLYASTSVKAIGIFGANAYSSCGAHIETATDADSGWAPFYINKFDWTSGDDARWMSFGVNGYGTDHATINYDGTNFAFNNPSDYRLKENIVDYSGGLAKLEELKVRTYNKKEGVSKHITQQGFIAHEAATANIPGFISGEKDAMKVNELGETVPDYQTVNKEALIPYLVSAIQELSAKVKELEAK